MHQTWPNIIARYETGKELLPAIRALHALSEFVASSDLAVGLYGWTAMWDLCLAQTPVMSPHNEPILKISPCSATQLQFRYLDAQVTGKQWHLIVDASEAIPRLLRFLDDLRWFSREALAAAAHSKQS